MVGSDGQGLLPEDELPGGDVPGRHQAPPHPRQARDTVWETLSLVLVQRTVL